MNGDAFLRLFVSFSFVLGILYRRATAKAPPESDFVVVTVIVAAAFVIVLVQRSSWSSFFRLTTPQSAQKYIPHFRFRRSRRTRAVLGLRFPLAAAFVLTGPVFGARDSPGDDDRRSLARWWNRRGGEAG